MARPSKSLLLMNFGIAVLLSGISTPVAAQDKSYYFRPTLNLRDTDVAKLTKWLSRWKIDIPFSVDGKVTIALQGGVPLNNLRQGTAYELDGKLTSSRLTVAGIELRDLSAILQYRGGVMRLTSLRFQLPAQNDAGVTTVTGTANMPISPRGDLSLNVDLANLDWSRVGKWLSVPNQLQGKVDGHASVTHKGQNFGELKDWSGTARLQSKNFALDQWSITAAELELAIANEKIDLQRMTLSGYGSDVVFSGALQLNEAKTQLLFAPLEVALLGGKIRMEGAIPLRQQTPQVFTIRMENLDLARLTPQLRNALESATSVKLPTPLAAQLNFAGELTVPFDAPKSFTKYRAKGTLQTPTLTVQNTSVRNAKVSVDFDGGKLDIPEIGWNWLIKGAPKGSVNGTGRIVLALFGTSRLDLRVAALPAKIIEQYLPIRATGSANGELHASVASLAIKNFSAWTFEVDLTGDALQLPDVNLRLEALKAALRSEELTVAQARVSLNGEAVTGRGKVRLPVNGTRVEFRGLEVNSEPMLAKLNGAWPLKASEKGELNLDLERFDLTRMAKSLPPNILDPTGPLELVKGRGTLSLSAADHWANRVVTGSFQVTGPIKGGVAFETSTGDWRNPKRWRGQIAGSIEKPLRVLERTLEGVAIDVDLRDATLDVRKISASVNQSPFRAMGKLKWMENPQAIEASDWKVEFLEGLISGSGKYPLSPTSEALADVDFQKINLRSLRSYLPEAGDLAGIIQGGLKLKLGAVDEKGERPATVSASLTAPELQYQVYKVTEVAGQVSTEKKVANYNLAAKVFGGRFQIRGAEALANRALQPSPGQFLQSTGTLDLNSVQLSQLSQNLKARSKKEAKILKGEVSAGINFTREPNESFQGTGQVRGTDLQFGEMPVSDSLRANLVLAANRLQLRDLAGSLLGGSADVTLGLNLENLKRGLTFAIFVRSLDLAALSDVLGSTIAVAGKGDLRMRGRISNLLRARGQISSQRTVTLDQEIGNWQAPFELQFNPTNGDGKLVITRVGGQLARGQLTGKLTYQWGASSSLSANATFTALDIQPLLRSASSLKNFGKGRVTGTASLEARPLRTMDDLTGVTSAKLTGIQAGTLPVFERVLPLIAGASGNATVFRDGTFKATLGRGVLRIQQLDLANPNVKLTCDGTIHTSGQLSLGIHAATGSAAATLNNPQLQSLLPTLLQNAAPPVAIITRVNRLLSDRVLAIEVTGTLSNPRTRILPLPTLTNEGIRFLIGTDIPLGTSKR